MSAEVLSRYGLHPRTPEVIDSSMLRDFMDCPSMFYLRHVLGLKKKYRTKQEDAKFDWGTAWHGLQEAYWAAAIRDLDNPGILALTWLNQNFPDSVDPATDKHGRSKERMVKMFFEYLENKVPEINDQYETLRLEQFFDVFNEELGFRWAGRIDKIRKNRRNGKIVIWDYKTASAMGPNYFDALEHGFQFPGYVWGANEIFTEPVEEIVADVLYTLKASHQFFRRTFRYTPQEQAEWLTNTRSIVNRMRFMLDNYLDQPEKWEQNRQECTRYGACQFTDIHFVAPIGDTRLRILENDYTEDRWDPLAHSDSEAA
jgi:RecB family exonuclease